jgi:hypothetical protein
VLYPQSYPFSSAIPPILDIFVFVQDFFLLQRALLALIAGGGVLFLQLAPISILSVSIMNGARLNAANIVEIRDNDKFVILL